MQDASILGTSMVIEMVGNARLAGTASIELFVVTDDSRNVDGNQVVFAQRYDADHLAIGGPIQVTTSDVSATPRGVLLLSNGAFVVQYDFFDPFDENPQYPTPPSYFATQEIGADNARFPPHFLGLNAVDVSRDYRSIALDGGAYAYVVETFEAGGFGSYTDTQTLTYVGGDGVVSPAVVLDTVSGGDGPFPRLFHTPATLNHLSDGRFTVSWTKAYTPEDPNFPSSPPVPSGEQRFDFVYRDDGSLTTKIFVDFDTSRLVENFDPATGRETSSVLMRPDGARVATRYDIADRYYAEQSIETDASGRIVAQERHFADGTLAFAQTNEADGTAEVHRYDTAGRETVRIVGDLSGARDTFEYTYAGAAATPATTTQTHYGAGDVKLWTDRTASDGSHQQVAKAAGAVLVSHAGVADTFAGFKGGADTFVFGQSFGKDVVKGFEAGAGAGHDVLRLDDGLASSFAELQGHVTQVGGDTLLSFGADTILLKGVAPGALTLDNVQFVHHDLLV